MERDSDVEDQCESQGEEDFDYDDDEDDGEEFDYDTIDFGDSESEQPTATMHPLLVQDIENVKQKYGEKAIGYRKFEDLGDVDIELHIPGSYFDCNVAKAWKIQRDEDIIVRLHMNLMSYLDAKQPTIEVFQPSQQENFCIGNQMKNVIQLLLGKVWNTFSNSPDADIDSGIVAQQTQKNKGKNPEPEASVSSRLNVKRLPTRDAGFLALIYEYCHQRLDTLNEFCVVCDEPHVFKNGPPMLKPTVCARYLCVFSFQAIGAMSDAAEDLATGAEVVDLVVTMAKAACKSNRNKLIFDPFPTVVNPINPQSLALNPSHKDFDRCSKALSVLDMQKLSSHLGPKLKEFVDSQDKLAYPLLQWLIISNRSYTVKLPESSQLSFMGTPHQFLLMSSPPAKEAIFRQYKKRYGSIFAFHGSNIENWHSIMRNGLINASGTRLQLNGAAHGNGIYLSPDAQMSYGYSGGHGYRGGYYHDHQSEADSGSRFLDNSGNLVCLALCEVINSSDLNRNGGDIWVMPDADKVCTRFFFVYDKHCKCEERVNTRKARYNSQIRQAVEYHMQK